jgi:hypothetical protein
MGPARGQAHAPGDLYPGEQADGGQSPAAPLWVRLFAPALTTLVALALLHPPLLNWYSMDAEVSLGIALFLHAASVPPAALLRGAVSGSPAGAYLMAGLLAGWLAWPLVVVAAALGAAAAGAPPELAVGMALLAACPPGAAQDWAPCLGQGRACCSHPLPLSHLLLVPMSLISACTRCAFAGPSHSAQRAAVHTATCNRPAC